MNEYLDAQPDRYPQEEDSALQDYLWLLRRRLWLILTVCAITVFTVYVKQIRTRPVYRAASRVLIERYNPQVVKVTEVFALDAYSTDYYPTQYRILESRAIAGDVIRELNLDRHPEFHGAPEHKLLNLNISSAAASLLRAAIPGARSHVSSASKKGGSTSRNAVIDSYLARLDIEPIRESRLVNIYFEGHEPALVAEVANAHAQAYINKNLEMKLSASQEAVDWLEDRLGELKSKLKASELALQQFQEQEDIVALEGVLTDSEESRENLVAQKLADLNTDLTAARTDRIGLETLYHQLLDLSNHPDMVESIPQVIDNGFIQNLKANYADLNRQYSELREKYGGRHPRMVALREEIRGVRSRIAAEVRKVAKSVEIQYRVALAKEKNIRGALEKVKKEVLGLNRRAVQYGVLKREVESNRQLYESILKRAKETSLTSGLKSTNVYIVDRATAPRSPVRPRIRKSVILAAFVSLLGGIGLVVFIEYLDNTIHSPKEVERYLNVPFLGSVGLAALSRSKQSDELVVFRDPRSNFVESLRTVRTNVVFSLTESSQKTLMVTSPRPMEGKTILSSNLAGIMARMGRRVLVVDADMRKPRLHHVMNVSSRPGLSNLVLGKCSISQAVHTTWGKRLYVLPSGTIPPNPAEILASRRMQGLVERLANEFDFVIFDTPPILSATDAAVLGGILNAVIVVAKASETTKESARLALKHLYDVHARVLGLVLNQVDFRKERFYYNNYYKHYDDYRSDEKREDPRHDRRVVAGLAERCEKPDQIPICVVRRKGAQPKA